MNFIFEKSLSCCFYVIVLLYVDLIYRVFGGVSQLFRQNKDAM